MLFDDLLEHFHSLLALVSQNETSRESFSRAAIVRLQLKQTQIKRNGFLDLLSGSVVVRDVLQQLRVVTSVFGGLFKNVIYARDVRRLGRMIGLKHDRGIKFSEAG